MRASHNHSGANNYNVDSHDDDYYDYNDDDDDDTGPSRI